MGDYQGGSSYVASGCLNENSYDDKCYVANGGVCDK